MWFSEKVNKKKKTDKSVNLTTFFSSLCIAAVGDGSFLFGSKLRPHQGQKKLWKMKLKCIFFLILLLATICQCDEHDHIVSKFEFFTFVVKGWVISKGISNLVPSSKNPKTNQCPSTFYFWLKRWGSVFWVLFLWEFLKGGLHIQCRITVLIKYFYLLDNFIFSFSQY